jgi:hypothetical protein
MRCCLFHHHYSQHHGAISHRCESPPAIKEKAAGRQPGRLFKSRGNDQLTMRYFTKPSGASPIFSTLMPAGW